MSENLLQEIDRYAVQYPRIAPEEAVAPLLERAGQVSPDTVGGQLELLRRLQGGFINGNEAQRLDRLPPMVGIFVFE